MKPVILIFTHYYVPGYKAGGPLRSIENLCSRLAEHFDFLILTSDRDIGDSSPYPQIDTGLWVSLHPSVKVMYLPHSRWRVMQFAKALRGVHYDLMYLNSFFDMEFTQAALFARSLGLIERCPVILAPRGEFSAGALSQKRLKKTVFIALVRWLQLYKKLTWQASTELEAQDIQRNLALSDGSDGRVVIGGNISVAADIVPNRRVKTHIRQVQKGDAGVRVCFLSRISQKKNLAGALDILKGVKVQTTFSIYGPIEDEAYWASCQAAIAKLPPNISVVYCGQLAHAEVVEALAAHDVFLFPTKGENYGHVIHEALTAGLVLLISQETPWRLLAEKHIGWDLPLAALSEFSNRIDDYATWTLEHRASAADAARNYAADVADSSLPILANIEMFNTALKNRNWH